MEIKDSGTRRSFETGAVRDMADGKGRCDLLPMDVVTEYLKDGFLFSIANYMEDVFHKYPYDQPHKWQHLYDALSSFCVVREWDNYTMLLEVAKQFEGGAKKYGDNNWRKGIPVNVYIDSAVRHYLKWRRGDVDEPHDRAVCWNLLCAVWTHKHINGIGGEVTNE